MRPADGERSLKSQVRYLGMALAAVLTDASAHHSFRLSEVLPYNCKE